MKQNNKKGFTLAELLIVVAIIAVLVAIAIPVFTTQLEKSREATDVANVRSAYATLVTKYLDDGQAAEIEVPAQQKDGWKMDTPKLQTMVDGNVTEVAIPAKTDKYIVKISADGAVTIE
jgi:type IV pilus assembly protein PilA